MRNPESAGIERRRYPRTNHILAARVCAELDEKIEFGKAIQVFAQDDHVMLRGIALRDELETIMSTTCGVRGVSIVSNQLETRDSPGNVIALQSALT
jgi:hypothetical protein